METIPTTDQAEKTRHQIEMVDRALIEEFPTLPADVVHQEVAAVSEGLLARAHITDHVAVLTGRFAAEHLRAEIEANHEAQPQEMTMDKKPESEFVGGVPNDEVGDFAAGQEHTHQSQQPHRFSEGEETLPDDHTVGDFATGEEKEHEHRIGTFASGEDEHTKP